MSIAPDEVILASNYINESEIPTPQSDAVGKVPKLESDGKLSGVFLRKDFGDGSDGDVTISSPTTLTRNMFYNNLVVNNTLSTAGYLIFVKGKISGTGTVQNNGANGGNGANASFNTNGSPAGAGGAVTSGWISNSAGAGGGVETTDGGDSASTTAKSINKKKGGAGGKCGYNPAGGFGAFGGSGGDTPTDPLFKFGILKHLTLIAQDTDNGKINAGNGGGGGASGRASNTGSFRGCGSGGGGGASGGLVVIFAREWAGTFTIKSTGGNGGNGGNGAGTAYEDGNGGAGGGGGAGGSAYIVYVLKSWTGSYTFTKGNGGTKGTGGNANNASFPNSAVTDGSAGEDGATATEIKIDNLI